MDAKELAAQRVKVQEQIDALLAKEQLSADDRTQVKTLEGEFENLSAQITAAEKLAQEDAEARQRAAQRRELLNSGVGRRTQPDMLSGSGVPVETTSIRVKPPEAFKSLGEQLQAIAGVALSGREDNRLTWENLAPATGAAVAGVPSDGGYLIQKDFTTELLGRMNELSEIKSRVRTVQIGANSDGLDAVAIDETSRATGSRWGGVQVYWGAEADAATAKKPKFRKMSWELKELIGLAYATNRLLRDASALASIFSQAFSEEMGFMIEDSLVNGNGAGMPLGIRNCPAVVEVSKETGQAAATIVYENLLKMHARLWARSRKNAVWLVNQDVEPQLDLLFHAVGTGGIPANFIRTDENGVTRIKGKPVIPVEYCQTLGTSGDIILADFSQVLAIEKDGMQADTSIHVRFTTNEQTFRFIYRYDAQPIWNSALTPYKGSATQSPFITLATRS
jgi:HK97 family phage major capsid protein